MEIKESFQIEFCLLRNGMTYFDVPDDSVSTLEF